VNDDSRAAGAAAVTVVLRAIVVGVSESGGGRNSVLGVVLCVVAAVCYAAGVVFQKPALGHASAVQVTTFGCFAGTVACLPFAGQLVSELGSAPASATLNRLLTDGPFMETKEHLLGFFLNDVPDLDAALDWAARMPNTAHGTTEVRAAVSGRLWQALLG
jgi:YCII-related domain